MASSSSENDPQTVIVGGGIIGCSIAYFLAKRGHRTLVIEQCDVACAASGKAGGFLARNWCRDSPLDELARVSFDLHEQLAEELSAHVDVGYRRVNTYSAECRSSSYPSSIAGGGQCHTQSGKRRSNARMDWFDGLPAQIENIGKERNTAQVHPRSLTQALLDAAIRMGFCDLRIARVSAVDIDDGKVTGVRLEENGEKIHATKVVFAMGPWTHIASDWLPIPNVSGTKAQSVVLSCELPATPCFVSYTDASGRTHDPEVYPRPDGTVYVSDSCAQVALPSNPSEIEPSHEESNQLLARAREMVTSLQNAEVLVRQSCYLPVSGANSGLPLVGRVLGVDGSYLATAHSCWGILLGPATGLAMSELIVDGQSTSVDLSPFQPEDLTASKRRK